MGVGNENTVGERTAVKKVLKTLGVVCIAVLAIIVVAFLLCIFAVKSNFNLAGYSLHIMNDQTGTVLPNGSIYLLKSIERGRTYIEDDVVTYTDEAGNEVPARILGAVEAGVEDEGAKDDADTATDEEIAEEAMPQYNVKTANGDVVVDEVMLSGTIEVYLPYVGYAINFIVTPFGLVCCVAIPLFLLLVFEIINLIRLPKSLKEEEETAPPLEKRTNAKQFEPQIKPILQDDDFRPTPIGKQSSIGTHDTISSTVSTKKEIELTDMPRENIFSETSASLLEDVEGVVELFGGQPESQAVSYEKPKNVVEPDKNDMQLTREYCLSASSLQAIASDARAGNKEEDLKVTPSAFSAELFEESPNRFKIDGINVNVEPDNIKLSLDDFKKNTDIAITVTKDYTNVTVGIENGEVDFALFRDEADDEQKVIIRKKSK